MLESAYFCNRKRAIYMEKTIFSQLETTALFAGLTANAIERQLERLPYSIRKVPAKTVFLSANEPLREMVMVLEGRVSAKMTTPKGKCLMVDLLKPGTILAPAFVFSDDNRMPVEVEAVEESVFFSMSKSHFSMLIGRNEQVRANFLGILSHINFFLMNKIRMLHTASVKEKIAAFLLRRARGVHSRSVVLHLSRKQLADVFAIQKSSLIRTLNELERDNLIFVREKEIVLIDVPGLQKIVKG